MLYRVSLSQYKRLLSQISESYPHRPGAPIVHSERLAVTTPGNEFRRCCRKVDQRKGKGSKLVHVAVHRPARVIEGCSGFLNSLI